MTSVTHPNLNSSEGDISHLDHKRIGIFLSFWWFGCFRIFKRSFFFFHVWWSREFCLTGWKDWNSSFYILLLPMYLLLSGHFSYFMLYLFSFFSDPCLFLLPLSLPICPTRKENPWIWIFYMFKSHEAY